MPWAWGTQFGGGLAGRGGHLLLPLWPFGIDNLNADWRSQRASMTNAGRNAQLIALEAHARSATKAEPTTCHLIANCFNVNWQPRRQSFDDDGEAWSVALAGG